MGHYEDRQVEMDSYSSEYEPPSEYKVHWRTFAAVFALAMGNVCAAMSNTVSKSNFPAFDHLEQSSKLTYLMR